MFNIKSMIVFLATGVVVGCSPAGDKAEDAAESPTDLDGQVPIVIFCDTSSPQQKFAAGDILAALNKRGQRAELRKVEEISTLPAAPKIVISLATNRDVLDAMVSEGGDSLPDLGEQAYVIQTTAGEGRSFWVFGGDTSGAMYGGLRVAEHIALAGLNSDLTETEKPYIKKRGIKFNIPLDQRCPSYDDDGTAAMTNIEHMWDMAFWTEYFDELARSRYNVISFWSEHPFSAMVTVPGYEKAAVSDVRDYEGLVMKMSMEQKIRFWQDVMKYASDRGFEVYWINWNIWTWGATGKYGITDDLENQVTIDYTRKSVFEFLKTYPDITGLGVSAGEHFGDASFEEREAWLYATFGKGMEDYKAFDSDRKLTFIHRYLDSGVGSIMKEFEALPYPIEISYKYTLGHLYTYHAPTYIYKTHDTQENVIAQLDKYQKKCWLNLRNDDIFYLRWGDPDYVRDYLTNVPDKDRYVAGYYMGSDGYVWGRVFSQREEKYNGGLEIKKQWLQFMLWGRLGYNPDLPNSLFESHMEARFPGVSGKDLFNAWSESSKVVPTTCSLIWWLWDGQWYVEGSKSAEGFRSVTDFIDAVRPQGAPVYSIRDYKLRLESGEPMVDKTPFQVADEISKYSMEALEGLRSIKMGNEELALVVTDIRLFSYLGLYYAEKIRAATYHHLGKTQDAVDHMKKSYWHWIDYNELGGKTYKDQVLSRTGKFAWNSFNKDAARDIILVGGDGPGERP